MSKYASPQHARTILQKLLCKLLVSACFCLLACKHHSMSFNCSVPNFSGHATASENRLWNPHIKKLHVYLNHISNNELCIPSLLHDCVMPNFSLRPSTESSVSAVHWLPCFV